MVMKQLHPGAKWQFRVNGFFGMLFLFIFFGIWGSVAIGGFLVALFGNGVILPFILFLIFIFIIFLVLIEVFARLSYKFWKYDFTQDQLRIEKGIIWKKYSNIPYQRIQNVDITRGIIARMLGFSSVNIQTAGYSMPVNSRGYAMHSEGYIHAVSMQEAEQIREFIMKKITKRSGQGL